MLHITDGESVAGTLRESAVPGVVSTHGDLMYEGPAPAGLDAEAWRETRARFLARNFSAPLAETQQFMKACEDTLASFPKHEEVVIWLDHRLSNQLILIKVLDWFSRQDLRGVKLSLICVDYCPGVDHFIALGALTAPQLASLIDLRVAVAEPHFRAARAAWEAFTSPDPTDIQRFIETDTSVLPFIASAFRRHLEQFPSVENGLSRTERQALSLLREHGSLSGPRLFVAVQHREEAIFMGDASFYRLMSDLFEARHALVRTSGSLEDGLGDVSITETGLEVSEGRADHIALNGIDKWLGGVYLKGDKSAWRWNAAAKRIVKGV